MASPPLITERFRTSDTKMSSKVKKNGRNGGKKLFKGENLSKVILTKTILRFDNGK